MTEREAGTYPVVTQQSWSRALLLALILSVLGVVAAVRVGMAGTCVAPDDSAECSAKCNTKSDCNTCCLRSGGNPTDCRSACASVQMPRHAGTAAGPHRQPSQPAPIGSGSVAAQCSLRQTGRTVQVSLRVENGTGAPIANVVPKNPFLQIDTGTQFVLSTRPTPRGYSVLRNGSAVTFTWRGRLNSAGAVGISASASATDANGAAIDTPLIDCGTATQAQRPPRTQRPRPSRPGQSPSLNGQAAACAACHETTQMAFVAGKWAQSGHAASYDASAGNTFCARCHSPRQADPAATSADNQPIPIEQWEGVTCSSCHPPGAQRDQWGTPIATYDVATRTYTPVALRNANQLCSQCHTGRHAPTFGHYGELMIQWGVRCIDCHMAKIATDDPSVGETAAHDFKVQANLPKSCGLNPGGCHNDRSSGWALQQIRRGEIHSRDSSR